MVNMHIGLILIDKAIIINVFAQMVAWRVHLNWFWTEEVGGAGGRRS